MIAGRAGGYYIGPDVLSAHMFGQDMVDRQFAGVPSTVLADIIITAEDLSTGQFDLQAWAVDHLLQPYDGWPREGLFNGLDVAASIHHHVCLPRKDQANGAAGITNIDRLEVGVENQYRRVHSFYTLACIILQTNQVG